MTKIDSQYLKSEVIISNPDSPCPHEVLQSLGLMEVEYIGFDNSSHKGQIVVAIDVMAEVEAFFKNAYEIKFPVEKVIPAGIQPYGWDDGKLMAANATSGFNYRVVAGTKKLSQHALGRAFDVNPKTNPCIRLERDKKIVRPPKAAWDRNAPGALFAEHPLVKLMEGFGWEWGGNWTLEENKIVDYQHFQKVL